MGIGTGGEAAGDTYVSIEGITGSEFADSLIGNALAKELVGGCNGALEALAGGDVLVGGAGNDTASYLLGKDQQFFINC